MQTADEFFPADMLLLKSSAIDGTCFVETKGLDGDELLARLPICSPKCQAGHAVALVAMAGVLRTGGLQCVVVVVVVVPWLAGGTCRGDQFEEEGHAEGDRRTFEDGSWG